MFFVAASSYRYLCSNIKKTIMEFYKMIRVFLKFFFLDIKFIFTIHANPYEYILLYFSNSRIRNILEKRRIQRRRFRDKSYPYECI